MFKLLLLTTCLLLISAQTCRVLTPERRNNTEWRAQYTNTSYNSLLNQTTLCYSLTIKPSNQCGSKACKNLSHWTLAFCAGSANYSDLIVSWTGNVNATYGCDPTTGVTGFKFDNGQTVGTTQTYCITFKGHWGTSNTSYAVKGGTYYEDALAIEGPCKIAEPVDEPVDEPKTCEQELPTLFENAKKNLYEAGCNKTSYKKLDQCSTCKQLLNIDRNASSEWSVIFVGVKFNTNPETTTFTYQLTASCGDSEVKDLSHWTLAVCSCKYDSANVSSSLYGSQNTVFGCDPTTGTWGFKFDAGQPKCTTQTYDVTVQGHATIGITSYAVKGGTHYSSHPIIGPTCDNYTCEEQKKALENALEICKTYVSSSSILSLSVGFLVLILIFI